MAAGERSRAGKFLAQRTRTLLGAQHWLITRRQALDLGYSQSAIARKLRSGEWIPVYRGIYRPAIAPTSPFQAVMAAALAAGPGAVASHRAAAFLLQLEGVDDPVAELSVTGSSRSVPEGITVHVVTELPPCDLTVVRRIPTTNATRTLLDLGASVKDEAVELALEDALRRGLTTTARLNWRIAELCRQGRRGCGALKRVLEARGQQREPTASALESRVARLMRKHGLPTPVRQYEIRDHRRVVARLDFAFPDQRVAVEADSYRWHSGRIPWERELNRRNELQRRGWLVIHVTDRQMRERPSRIVEDIQNALATRDHPATPPRLFPLPTEN